MATQQQVRQAHVEHPDWSAADIAKALDCCSGYVRGTAQRLNITLPRSRPESILTLGAAARDAGLTSADIARLAGEGARETLELAREEIVLTIAFLGRDADTNRLPATIESLIARLAKADASLQRALTVA